MRPGSTRSLVPVLLFWAVLPAAASAQAHVDATGCAEAGLDQAAIEAGLEIELADAAEALSGGSTVIALACGAEGVRIEVGDAITDKRVIRTVAMPTVDRERVITLAIAQLVLTSWLELLVAPRAGPEADAAETVAREAVREADEPAPEQGADAPEPLPPPETETSVDAPAELAPPPWRQPLTAEGALDVGARVRLEGESLVAVSTALRGQLVVEQLVLVGLRAGFEWSRAFRDRGTVDTYGASLALRAGLRSPRIGSFFVDGAVELGADLVAYEGRPSDPSAVQGGTTVSISGEGLVELAPSFRADALIVAFPLAIGALVLVPDAVVTGERSVVMGGAIFSAGLRVAVAP